MREALKVWNAYQMYVGSQFVLRGGFKCFGLTQESEKLPNDKEKSDALLFFERGDSDLEHQAKAAMLAGLMMNNYPGYFKGIDCFLPRFEQNRIGFFTLMTMLAHDTGEGIKVDGKKIGDIVDNENGKHAAKFDEEFKRFREFVEMAFDEQTAVYLLSFFGDMAKHSFSFGWSFYGIDKEEPILFMTHLEKNGLSGHYRSSKEDGASDNDLRCIEIAGTDNALDCISVHLRMQLAKAPKHVTEPLYDVLREAIVDTRGKFFSWWDKDIPEFRP